MAVFGVPELKVPTFRDSPGLGRLVVERTDFVVHAVFRFIIGRCIGTYTFFGIGGRTANPLR